MTIHDLRKELVIAFASALNYEHHEISDDLEIFESITTDELAYIELIQKIEGLFGLIIAQEDMDRFKTFRDILNYLANHFNIQETRDEGN